MIRFLDDSCFLHICEEDATYLPTYISLHLGVWVANGACNVAELHTNTSPFTDRVKAGLKLQEEAEKREVQQGIHLLQDPKGEA